MRSFVAGLAVFLAFLTGTAALGAFVAHEVVLDPSRAGLALDAMLSDRELSNRVLGQIVPGISNLPAPLMTVVRQAALDPSVHRAVRKVTFDPHSGEISLKPIQSEVLSQLRRFSLGAAATNGGDAVITVPQKDLARYNDARTTSWRVARLGGLATVVLLAIALLISPRRVRTLRSIGLLTIVSCVLVAAAAWTLPAIVRAVTSSIAGQAVAVVASAARSDALVSLAPFAVAGVVLVVVSLLGGRQRPTA
ncbi:MAG: hypothetical protein QOK15_3852 [Nocardioidaceae bacterium]|nr:hypothetical protein [Nocardioidaceae bacterium]